MWLLQDIRTRGIRGALWRNNFYFEIRIFFIGDKNSHRNIARSNGRVQIIEFLLRFLPSRIEGRDRGYFMLT